MKHKVENSEDMNDIDSSCTNDDSEDGKSDTSHNDQDSDVSFAIENDEEIDVAEIEEEEWVEYIKRSTIEALEKMENEKIRSWKLTQRKMKWRLVMKIATSQKERRLIKAAEWHLELGSKYRTNRSIGRPRKRWVDDTNEFLKQIVFVLRHLDAILAHCFQHDDIYVYAQPFSTLVKKSVLRVGHRYTANMVAELC